LIISISGKARSGKDTISDILVKYYGYRKISWADPMKMILSEALSIDLEDFYSDTKDDAREVAISAENAVKILDILTETYGEVDNYTNVRLSLQNTTHKSIRELLQWFGTNICRDMIDNEIWIKITLDSLDPSDLIVIPDARMYNEREAISKLGGVKILVQRDTGISDNHVSENQLGNYKDYDVIVENDSCRAHLECDLLMWHSIAYPNIERL